MPGEWIKVGTVRQLPPGSRKRIVHGRLEIAVFNVGGTYHAIKNVCPHEGVPLHDGTLDGDVLSCRAHGWKFELPTGQCPGAITPSVSTFKVEVRGEEVYVEV